MEILDPGRGTEEECDASIFTTMHELHEIEIDSTRISQ